MAITMRNIKVRAGRDDDSRSLDIHYPMGGTLEELVKQFGPEIVYEHAYDNIIIGLQAFVRSQLVKEGEKRLSDQQILAKVYDDKNEKIVWRPSTRKEMDPKKREETLKKLLAKMPPDAVKALLAQMETGENKPKLVKGGKK